MDGNVQDIETVDVNIFMDAARPELFYLNAFRMIELPVDATPRLLLKRQQTVELAANTGLQIPDGPGRALSLDRQVGIDAVNEAMERLRDPQKRLIEEFFWFWPHQLGRSQRDEALQTLAQGDIRTATEIWLQQEQYSESNVSIHNLAILAHSAALDLELASYNRVLTTAEENQRDLFWQEAYKRWKVLLDQEGFWSRLADRIRELDDPRLVTGMARRVRSSLPVILLLIQAKLALQAAEKNEKVGVGRHLTIMRHVSGFSTEQVDEALARSIEPVRERIRMQINIARDETGKSHQNGARIGNQLVERAWPLLKIVDQILPAQHATIRSLHDEISEQLRSCAIAYFNETQYCKDTLHLIAKALEIVSSPSVRNQLLEDQKAVKEVEKFGDQEMNDTCWFCGKKQVDEAAAIEIKMYGEVQRVPVLYNRVEVRWKYRTIKVPRCHNCKADHQQTETRVSTIIFIGLLISVGLGIFVLAISNDGGSALCLGSAVFTLVMGLGAYAGTKHQKGIKPESAKNDFPPIVALKAKGWVIGEKPVTEGQ